MGRVCQRCETRETGESVAGTPKKKCASNTAFPRRSFPGSSPMHKSVPAHSCVHQAVPEGGVAAATEDWGLRGAPMFPIEAQVSLGGGGESTTAYRVAFLVFPPYLKRSRLVRPTRLSISKTPTNCPYLSVRLCPPISGKPRRATADEVNQESLSGLLGQPFGPKKNTKVEVAYFKKRPLERIRPAVTARI